jgi:hypothetical protein
MGPDLLNQAGGVVRRVLSVGIHDEDIVTRNMFVNVAEPKADGSLVADIPDEPQSVFPDSSLSMKINPSFAFIRATIIDENDPGADSRQTFQL